MLDNVARIKKNKQKTWSRKYGPDPGEEGLEPNNKMKFNSMDEINERKNFYIGLCVVAVIAGLIFSGLINFTIKLILWIIQAIIKYWIYILGGILLILFIKRIFRKKKN